jgi:hypothetical protein
VAVLKGQLDPEVAFQRAAHGVAGEDPQELAAGLLVRRWRPVVGELPAVHLETGHQTADHFPRVRQRGANALDERRVVDLTLLCFLQKFRRHVKGHGSSFRRPSRPTSGDGNHYG